MKSIVFIFAFIASIICSADSAGLTCDYIKSMKSKKQITELSFACATDDVACLQLEKQQMTYAMTHESSQKPVTDVSDDAFKLLNDNFNDVKKIQVKIGDYTIDGIYLGLGGKAYSEFFFEQGTVNPSPIFYYQNEIYFGDDLDECGHNWVD